MPNWKLSDLPLDVRRSLIQKPKRTLRGTTTKISPLEAQFLLRLTTLGLQERFIREHKAIEGRHWRIDFADPVNLVAVEIMGGVFSGGGHVRGQQYIRDNQKCNALTCAGWRVLRYSTVEEMRTFKSDYEHLLKK